MSYLRTGCENSRQIMIAANPKGDGLQDVQSSTRAHTRGVSSKGLTTVSACFGNKPLFLSKINELRTDCRKVQCRHFFIELFQQEVEIESGKSISLTKCPIPVLTATQLAHRQTNTVIEEKPDRQNVYDAHLQSSRAAASVAASVRAMEFSSSVKAGKDDEGKNVSGKM